MASLSDIQSQIERAKGKQELMQKELSQISGSLRKLKLDLSQYEEAQLIVQHVAKQTQEQLEYRISEIVTLALSSVFDEPYSLKVKFVIKRGKTECELLFERDGIEINPIEEAGGGPIDVAAFALRVALWSLSRPRPRNLIVLDEPFKHLDRNAQAKASRMLTEISGKLGIQIIMVTHSVELIEASHKVFEVKKIKGISKVEEI